MKPWRRVASPGILPWLLIGFALVMCAGVRAQDTGAANDGYQVQEGADPAPTAQDNVSNGPVRLARFTYIQGNVTWRGDESLEWSRASLNLPLRQGAQIYVAENSRAELQFDDGSFLRLGTGALVTLQDLHSDSEGEFTEIKLNDGLVSLNLRHDRAAYQIDTPFASVNATGPARLRVGVGQTVEVSVRQGQVRLEGRQGEQTLNANDYVELQDANAPFDITRAPDPDNWDEWNMQRDRRWQEAQNSDSHRNLPPDIAIVSDDLDQYGTWRDDPHYGEVWCPRVASSSWRPYCDGHWTWVNPFGWTWVADEPWGWAPYHYGTWVEASYGWAWIPGPVHQYWCPAVVNFCEVNGRVAWCPLAPEEVRYPSRLAIGFGFGNWSLFFSIGQAGVYYPTSRGFCEARPWNSGYVNHVTYINRIDVHGNPSLDRFHNSLEGYAANHNGYLPGGSFVPRNARLGGATLASASAFGGRGTYEAAPRSEAAAMFTHGQLVSAPAAGRRPLAGPPAVRPGLNALTPNRTFVQNMRPSSSILSRPVFQPNAGTFANRSGTFGTRQSPTDNRVATGLETHGRQLPAPSAGRDSRLPSLGGASSARAARPSWNTDRSVSSLPSRPQAGNSYRSARSESTAETIAQARASLGLPYHGRLPAGSVDNRSTSRPDISTRRSPETSAPRSSSQGYYLYGRENRSGYQTSNQPAQSQTRRSDPYTYRQVYSSPARPDSGSSYRPSTENNARSESSYRQNNTGTSGRGYSGYSAPRYQEQRSYQPPQRESYSYGNRAQEYSGRQSSGERSYAPSRRESSSGSGGSGRSSGSSSRSDSGRGSSDRGSRGR